jgi:hypothetical protein
MSAAIESKSAGSPYFSTRNASVFVADKLKLKDALSLSLMALASAETFSSSDFL